MAKKTKPAKDAKTEDDQATTTEIVEEGTEVTSDETLEKDEEPTITVGTNDPDATTETETTLGEDALESADLEAADEATPEEQPTEPEASDVQEVEPSDPPETASASDLSSDPVQKNGFIPMVLGGAVAAALGFGIASLVLPSATLDTSSLSKIQQRLDGQAGEDAKLNALVEVLEAGQSDNLAALSGLADRIADLETRLSQVETRPVPSGDTGAALSAVQDELNKLKSSVAAMTENAALLEENAQAAAMGTLRRAAFTRIQTALDAGVEFESAVNDLEGMGVSVPAALKQAAPSGVPSLNELEIGFPEAARAALAASRKATGDSGGGGLGSFLRDQLGARSLEPREGSDPDAILSRVEAAIRDGRLSDALAEIEALPEAGREALSEWASLATQRLDAVAAAHELGDSLN